MKISYIVAKYGISSDAFPKLVGRSGFTYGTGIWNNRTRRHEVVVPEAKWVGGSGRGGLTMERDVFNALGRLGAAWIVVGVKIEADDSAEVRQQERIEQLEADLETIKRSLFRMTMERDEATAMLLKATGGQPPEPPAAEAVVQSASQSDEQQPDVVQSALQAPEEVSDKTALRRAELEPKAYRDLRAIAKDDDHKLELPPAVSKPALIDMILRAEGHAI